MRKWIVAGLLVLGLAGSSLAQTLTRYDDPNFQVSFFSKGLKVSGYIVTSDSGAAYWDTCLVHRATGTIYTDWQFIGEDARSLKYLFLITALDTFWSRTYTDSYTVTIQTSAMSGGTMPIYNIWSKTVTDTATIYKDFSSPADTSQLYLTLPYMRTRLVISAWADSHRVHLDSIAGVSHPTFWKTREKAQGIK